MAEHSAVNRRVVGSSPTSGANKHHKKQQVTEVAEEVAFFVSVEWLFWWLLRPKVPKKNFFGR
jgi:hypothetical protein